MYEIKTKSKDTKTSTFNLYYLGNDMRGKERLENFWIWIMKKQNIKEIIYWAKWGKKN